MKSKFLSFMEEENLKNYAWLLPEANTERFMKKRLNKTLIVFVFMLLLLCVVAFINGITLNGAIGYILLTFLISYLIYKWDYLMLKDSFKRKKKDVYRSFPLWVSTLEILIMTNNITNTFKKSIATCPLAFKKDLEEFVKEIEFDPENKEHYRNFLRRYEIAEVNEIIMDMYAFNSLEKSEIVYEFKHLNERLNKISAKIRQERQSTDLFFIAALNSIPLMTVSIYVLMISMLLQG